MGSLPCHPTSTNHSSAPLNVAIIGGGIGGLALAHGLNKYPNIDYHVYEAAPAFSEIGAGLSVGINAQRALEMIGKTAKEAFDRRATSNLWSSHANTGLEYTVGKGPNAGKVIARQKNAGGKRTVHRSKFLDELVKDVPSHRSHFNKRLVGIEDKPGSPVSLQFTDGTTATTDAVIGADGIHSAVRAHLLGEESAQPTFAGSTVYRGLIPMERAIEKLGDEYAYNSYMVCGPDKAILSYPVELGTLLNIVGFGTSQKEWEHDKWIVPLDWSELDKQFEGWGPHARGLVELLNHDRLSTWALWDMPPAPTYHKNRVCILGDAAHATTPFQGAGAGQAIEDALVMEKLLGKVKEESHFVNAFSAFDAVRRPRTQKVVTTSREAGEVFTMKGEGVGEDLEKMRESIETRMDWIWGRDLKGENAEALRLFEESIEN